MMIWVFMLAFILSFLNSSEEALGQVYWKAKKDGSISFSDNPTSSILKDEPEEKADLGIEFQRDFLRLPLPGKNWALEFQFKDFRMKDAETLPDFEGRRILAENDKTQVLLSVFLTPAKRPMHSKDLREAAWKDQKKLPLKREAVKKYEAGEWALFEYVIKDAKEFKGINQKNVFAFHVKGDTWIDYHLSKAFYKPADEKLFNDFIKSVKILQPFSPSSWDNFLFGSHYYRRGKYMKAIVYYEQALAQEKQNPRLEKDFGRVLIDCLGMAYGLTGNLEMSKKTLEYGISKDPTFPMYYYNLACTYAEMNNLEKAVQNLKTAARYKNNMIPGERPPDAFKDSSFKRFLNNPKFVDAAKAFR